MSRTCLPTFVYLEAGTYRWCSCGRSKADPECDGSHKGTKIKPVVLTVEEAQTAVFCGLKKSASDPFCDGCAAL